MQEYEIANFTRLNPSRAFPDFQNTPRRWRGAAETTQDAAVLTRTVSSTRRSLVRAEGFPHLRLRASRLFLGSVEVGLCSEAEDVPDEEARCQNSVCRIRDDRGSDVWLSAVKRYSGTSSKPAPNRRDW